MSIVALYKGKIYSIIGFSSTKDVFDQYSDEYLELVESIKFK